MGQKNSVIFRRVRGRVVPIHMSQSEKNDLKIGSASAAAGLLLPAAAGNTYKRMESRARDLARGGAMAGAKARDILRKTAKKGGQMSFEGYAAAKPLQETAKRLFRQARTMHKASAVVRNASVIGGAGLLSYGASKVARVLVDQKHKDTAEKVALGAGAIATTAFAFGMFPKATIRNVLKRHTDIRKIYQWAAPGIAKIISRKF